MSSVQVFDTVCIGSRCRWAAKLKNVNAAISCGSYCDAASTVHASTARSGMALFAHAKVALGWNDMFLPKGEAMEKLRRVPFLKGHPMYNVDPSSLQALGNPRRLVGSQMKSRILQAFFGRCVLLLRWLPPPFQILERLGFRDGEHFLYVYNDTHAVELMERVLADYARYVPIADAGFEYAARTLTQRAFVRDFVLPMFVPPDKRPV